LEVRVVVVSKPLTVRLSSLVEMKVAVVPEDSMLETEAMVVVASSVEANFVDTPSVVTELSIVVTPPVNTVVVEPSTDVLELVTAKVSSEVETRVVA
jgi:hypothetical protein